jgi:hypothetical protein
VRGASARGDADDRCAGGSWRAVSPPFRQHRAVRAEPSIAVHGDVRAEPPLDPERHAARRPASQHRQERAIGRLHAGAVRLHRHERRSAHRGRRRSAAVQLRGRARRVRPRGERPRDPRLGAVGRLARTAGRGRSRECARPVRTRCGFPRRRRARAHLGTAAVLGRTHRDGVHGRRADRLDRHAHRPGVGRRSVLHPRLVHSPAPSVPCARGVPRPLRGRRRAAVSRRGHARGSIRGPPARRGRCRHARSGGAARRTRSTTTPRDLPRDATRGRRSARPAVRAPARLADSTATR